MHIQSSRQGRESPCSQSQAKEKSNLHTQDLATNQWENSNTKGHSKLLSKSEATKKGKTRANSTGLYSSA